MVTLASFPCSPPRISVVISTYNRIDTIRDTIRSLLVQEYPAFEVIVVNGPSTDGTDRYLAGLGKLIKTIAIEDRNLSVSRNRGIDLAAGDVVAFIDDDAVADPHWLKDLAQVYQTEPDVGGVGGLVYDNSGTKLQYNYSACFRRGQTDFDIEPPFDRYLNPGADPFLYLQGTNCSFRRDALLAIGGFNEAIEYFHDETEVCMRVIDHGLRLVALRSAAVIHRYAPSHIRDRKKVVFDPYTSVKNQHLFAIQNGFTTQTPAQVFHFLGFYTRMVQEGARWQFRQGNFTAEQTRHFMRRVQQAVIDGVRAGSAPRRLRDFPARPPAFRGFQRLAPPDGRGLHIVYITDEYPPQVGGIGRFTQELAQAVADWGTWFT